jgi:NAD(P)H-flavin reductase
VYRILHRENLAPNIHLLRVEAPAVAAKAQPGQFVMIMVDERGERIPLTIADWDRDEGSISIVFMELGTSTRKLAALNSGDHILNFVGPLGLPTHIDNFGTVVLAAGCFAVGPIISIARALKEMGNKVISIMEARSKNLLYWERSLGAVSDELIVTTGDGSYGYRGWATDPIRELLQQGEKVDRVIAIGCTFMMKECAEATRPFGVKTIVSLNPIMVDGTGMCGCCRVEVGGVTKFACVDGPDFDGHEVDWDLLLARQRIYLLEEEQSLDLWERENWHKVMLKGR